MFDHYPAGDAIAALTAFALATAGVVTFIGGWHHAIHDRPDRGSAFCGISCGTWLLAGAVLVIVNPIISGFMFAVFALVFRYGTLLEGADVPQVMADASRPALVRDPIRRPVYQVDPVDLDDLDRGFRWNAPPSIFKYPASFHGSRRRGLHTYSPGCCAGPDRDGDQDA